MLIDLHVHTCRKRHPGLTRPNGSRYPTPPELLATMDDHGIDRALCMCGVSPECRYTLVPPEEVIDICAAAGGRLIPSCNIDPRYLANSPSSNFEPLLRAYVELGCRAVGEYVPNLPFDDPLNLRLFEQVEAVGLPLTFHIAPAMGGNYGCWDEPGLPRLERVLQRFPDLVFLGHSQCFWAEVGQNTIADGRRIHYPDGPVQPGRLPDLFRAYPNLHGDLSANSGYTAIHRDRDFGIAFLNEFQDRLCFGTDIANVPQALPIVTYLTELRDTGTLAADAYEKIAWQNAARILRL